MHEKSIGASDEWYTPPFIFDALGLEFDLDPCSPGEDHWVPATTVYTSGGIERDWFGTVFMNPPFGPAPYSRQNTPGSQLNASG